MARLKRVVVPGLPHHVTQRGVRRCDTFIEPQDREVYGRLMLDNCRRYSLAIHAYCWMTNHVHLVAVPGDENSLAFALRDTSGLYATYFNRKYGYSGHLWQARFFSCVLDEQRYWPVIRYVERNPVRARMVSRAEDYSWSSAPAHCCGQTDPLVTPFERPQLIADWSAWLADEEEGAELKAIRLHTRTGRPLGSESFLKELEARLGRPITPQKRGPKPKGDASLPLEVDLDE